MTGSPLSGAGLGFRHTATPPCGTRGPLLRKVGWRNVGEAARGVEASRRQPFRRSHLRRAFPRQEGASPRDSASRPSQHLVSMRAQRATATEPKAPSLTMLRSHRSEILRVAKAHGASNIRLFGSVARGPATPASDLNGWSTSNLGAHSSPCASLARAPGTAWALASTSSALEVSSSAATTSGLTRSAL